jgi:hypothetical protein
MTELARQRIAKVKSDFPEVKFEVLHLDTLADNFYNVLGTASADLVVCSWNIEYYTREFRRTIVQRLVDLAQPQGVVAFSSTVSLPEGLSMRDVLMPLGKAQVFQALLTGGPYKMRKVVRGLKQIAIFGTAIGSTQFPEKPDVAELADLALKTGLKSIETGYHLFGASCMIVARKDEQSLPPLPITPIAKALAKKPGYDACSDTVSFLNYFMYLMRNRPEL